MSRLSRTCCSLSVCACEYFQATAVEAAGDVVPHASWVEYRDHTRYPPDNPNLVQQLCRALWAASRMCSLACCLPCIWLPEILFAGLFWVISAIGLLPFAGGDNQQWDESDKCYTHEEITASWGMESVCCDICAKGEPRPLDQNMQPMYD